MKKMTRWIKVLTGTLFAVAFLVIAGVLCPTDAYAGGWDATIVVQYGTLNQNGEFKLLDQGERSGSYAEVILPCGKIVPEGANYHTGEYLYGDFPECWLEPWEQNGNTWFLYELEVGNYTLNQATLRCPTGYEVDDALGLGEGTAYPLSYYMTAEELAAHNQRGMEEAGHDDYTIQVPVKKIGSTSAVLTPVTLKPTLSVQKFGGIVDSIYVDMNYNINDPIQYGVEFSYAEKENGSYEQLTEISKGCWLQDIISYPQLKNGKTYYIRGRLVKTVNGQKIYGPYSDPVKYTVKYATLDNTVIPKVSTFTNGVNIDMKRLVVAQDYAPACQTIVYYSTSKKGTYKKLTTLSEGRGLMLNQYAKLKKGKTYYFKFRYTLTYTYHDVTVSSKSGLSKVVAVKKKY